MIYKSTVTVRYNETDRMGITHHSIYPIWFEEARSQWIKASGVPYSEVERRGILLPLIDLHCHYYGTSDYMDKLTIHSQIIKLSAARMTFHYDIYKGTELITEGSTDHAWVSSSTFRPINIKKHALDLYLLMENAMKKNA